MHTSAASTISKPALQADERMEATRATALKLLSYCRANDWAGHDPYDALNSRIFQALPFLNFKLARLALTQANKRSPINLRPLLLVPKSHNPKGLALFLVSWLKLSRAGLVEDDGTAGRLADRILTLRSENTPYTCWGYNFAWQTRFELVPRGLPNIICTTFAGNALLDLHESSREPRYLEAAVSAANFIFDVLYWKPSATDSCFSYTPLWRAQVHNANLLGAAFLCRVAQESGDGRFWEPALAAARFSVKRQYDDGSWDYGESDSPSQRWKDNFHTGYNLCALRNLGRAAKTSEFEPAVRSGFKFYRDHFFREDGAPKYYHNATYPIDVHSVAQSVITLMALRDLDGDNVELARAVLAWAISNLWDERRSYFYCQKHRCYTVKIPYIRWAQAWMLLALATMLEHGIQEVHK
jgi:hypothetical protein